MKALTVLVVSAGFAATLANGGAAHAQDPSNIAAGQAAFQHTCAPCHGAGPGNDGTPVKPGVNALQLKYKGTEPALIEHRTDLPYAALKAIVRTGTGAMAPFRPTEVTDAQLEAIAAYIADAANKWKAGSKTSSQ